VCDGPAVNPVNLDRLRERWADPLLTVLTILLVTLLFVVIPLQALGHFAFQASELVLALLLMAGVFVMSGSRTAIATMLGALTMIVVGVTLRLKSPSVVDLNLFAGAWLVVGVTLAWAVARATFAAGRITYHRVLGAILFYLMVAVIFAALFMFLGTVVPNAFKGMKIEDDPALASQLIYFSFATMTTTGYGDVAPLHPLARSLCNLEAIFGQLYPATLLARLMTLELNHRPMPLDAGAQDLIHRTVPPRVGKDLDLGIAGKALRLDGTAQGLDIDDAVTHHAAIVEDVPGRHQPVADMKCEQPLLAGARDLRMHLDVPPDMIDVERDTERAGARRIKPVADVERLPGRVHAGTVGGIGRMQRLDRERHLRFSRMIQHFGDGVVHLRARRRDILGHLAAGPRKLRQPADHKHDAGRAQRLGFIDAAAVIVAYLAAARGVGGKHPAAAIA
jgi:hypothetical protein